MRKVCRCGKEYSIGNRSFSGLYECPECEAKSMRRKYGKAVRVYPNVTLSLLTPGGQRYETYY